MSSNYFKEVKKLLTAAGCVSVRQGKGDHEIWFSPITNRHFPVDAFHPNSLTLPELPPSVAIEVPELHNSCDRTVGIGRRYLAVVLANELDRPEETSLRTLSRVDGRPERLNDSAEFQGQAHHDHVGR